MPFKLDPKTGQYVQIDPTTGQPISQPGMDAGNPDFQQPAPQSGGLFSNIKSFVKSAFPATANFAKDVGSSLQAISPNADSAQKAVEASNAAMAHTLQMAEKETDPARKKKLQDLAASQAQVLDQTRKTMQPDYSEDINKNPLERGLAVGAELAPLVLTPEASAIKGSGFKAVASRVASMARQGAEMSGVRAATSLQDMTPEERLKSTLQSAGMGALLVGGAQAAGEAAGALAKGTSAAGDKVSEAGSAVRQSVRKIKEPAGVWGSEKEDAINSTLDRLNINGTAAEQYKQLAPRYNELTKAINQYLDEESKPFDYIKFSDQLKSDLEDIPGNVIKDKQGYYEYEKITGELTKVENSKDLFNMKQWLNGRLGRVYRKIETGNPLTAPEEVILASRDSLDNMIAEMHPELKDLTMTQSQLRDAAPSLARARLVTPTTRVMGTTVPTGITQKAQDLAGRGLQKTGSAIGGAGDLFKAALDKVAPITGAIKTGVLKAAPILAAPNGTNNGEANPADNGQGNTQNNDNQNIQNHPPIVPQTATVTTGMGVDNALAGAAPTTPAQPQDIQARLNSAYMAKSGAPSGNPLAGYTVDGKPIPPATAQLVKNIADYKVDISKVTSLRSDQRQMLAGLVAQYDPSWDMTQYPARAALRQDFTSGKSAQTIRSLNTAIGHLQALSDAGNSLGNTSIPLFNQAKNATTQAFGGSSVTKFNNAINAVAGEMSTVFKGSSGTDQEITSWKNQMNAAQSPAQINDGINMMIELMGSRLSALDSQWQTGMGKPRDFRLLNPNSVKILTKLGVDVSALDPNAAPQSAPTGLQFNNGQPAL